MSYDLSRIGSVAKHLDAMQNECMITLALKIVDDSCKMDDYERGVFMQVYDAMPHYHSDLFPPDIFDLIKETRHTPTAMLFAKIRPFRQAGMEYVSRPAMKSFKAYVRQELRT